VGHQRTRPIVFEQEVTEETEFAATRISVLSVCSCSSSFPRDLRWVCIAIALYPPYNYNSGLSRT
jgi:hypothetical protein